MEEHDFQMEQEHETHIRGDIDEHREVFAATAKNTAALLAIIRVWRRSLRAGGKLLLFGNGGSAANAQHIAAELVIRYQEERAAIAAISLATDAPMLTACGNDLGFERIFARQLAALGRRGDVAVGISTSGRSANVIAGLREARARGLDTTGLTGGDAGDMPALCDALIVVPSSTTARIQEMHVVLGHILCKELERQLTLA